MVEEGNVVRESGWIHLPTCNSREEREREKGREGEGEGPIKCVVCPLYLLKTCKACNNRSSLNNPFSTIIPCTTMEGRATRGALL